MHTKHEKMLNTSVCAWIEVVNQICNQIYMVFLRVKKLKKCKYIWCNFTSVICPKEKPTIIFWFYFYHANNYPLGEVISHKGNYCIPVLMSCTKSQRSISVTITSTWSDHHLSLRQSQALSLTVQNSNKPKQEYTFKNVKYYGNLLAYSIYQPKKPNINR